MLLRFHHFKCHHYVILVKFPLPAYVHWKRLLPLCLFTEDLHIFLRAKNKAIYLHEPIKVIQSTSRKKKEKEKQIVGMRL